MNRTIMIPSREFDDLVRTLSEAGAERGRIAARYIGDPYAEHLAAWTVDGFSEDCEGHEEALDALGHDELDEVKSAHRRAYLDARAVEFERLAEVSR